MIQLKTNNGGSIIDISGPEGNAFVLLGYAQKFSKQLDMDTDKIIQEMKAGGYDNLIETFEDYFGEYITLIK